MLVVLASRFDVGAVRLVEQWRDRGLRLLTCSDLSLPGWVHLPGQTNRSHAVVEGLHTSVESIRGVLSLLPRVSQFELSGIVAEERAYVASEMMAFLLAWLSSLSCTVLNRPTPLSLTGPAWYREQWLLEAKRAGLKTVPLHRSSPSFAEVVATPRRETSPGASRSGIRKSIAVVGARCFADDWCDRPDEDVVAGVRRLAAAAGVDLMTVSFERREGIWTFEEAACAVDVTNPEIAAALIARLEASS